MRKQKTKQPNVSETVIEALEAMLAHFWEDERKDYHNYGRKNPNRRKHIFLKLAVIRHWLDYGEDSCCFS